MHLPSNYHIRVEWASLKFFDPEVQELYIYGRYLHKEEYVRLRITTTANGVYTQIVDGVEDWKGRYIPREEMVITVPRLFFEDYDNWIPTDIVCKAFTYNKEHQSVNLLIDNFLDR